VQTACDIGLVNEAVAPDKLEEALERWVKRFLHSGPEAVKACKELIARVSHSSIGEAKGYTAEVIAKLRISQEGKEGFAAFFEKRDPPWDVRE
jgi:methylglutaconyl-CoA hydratase